MLTGRADGLAGPDLVPDLTPIERAGYGFVVVHDLDPAIRRVRIVEARIDRVGFDRRTGRRKRFWSSVSRDPQGDALASLGRTLAGRPMRDRWRLGSLTLEVHLEEGAAAPTTLRVALDPSSPLVIKPSRHAVRIIRLLWRNGLIHDRYDRTLVDAAE